jgi:hypothetical protein
MFGTFRPFVYRLLMIFCAAVAFTKKATKSGKTKLHAKKKESYDFLMSTNILTACVILYATMQLRRSFMFSYDSFL